MPALQSTETQNISTVPNIHKYDTLIRTNVPADRLSGESTSTCFCRKHNSPTIYTRLMCRPMESSMSLVYWPKLPTAQDRLAEPQPKICPRNRKMPDSFDGTLSPLGLKITGITTKPLIFYNCHILNIAGTKQIVFVSIIALITSSSGKMMKVKRPIPITWADSKNHTNTVSVHLALRIFRKKTIRLARIKVPTSGMAKAKTNAHIQAICWISGMTAYNSFSGSATFEF